jgi:hypothetical protein
MLLCRIPVIASTDGRHGMLQYWWGNANYRFRMLFNMANSAHIRDRRSAMPINHLVCKLRVHTGRREVSSWRSVSTAHLTGLSKATYYNQSLVINTNKQKHQMAYGFLSSKCQINHLDIWTEHFCSIVKWPTKCVKEPVDFINVYPPTCFGKWLPCSRDRRCLRS